MENKDKIYDQFKEAATKAEDKNFARMDAVWNRVEEKLDKKKERRTAIWWKYTGIAALFLLFMGLGTYMLNNKDAVIVPQAIPQNNVTVIDTPKVKETTKPAKENVVAEEVVVATGTTQKTDGNLIVPAAADAVSTSPDYDDAGNKGKPILFVGTVTDNSGLPLPNVNVIISGRKTATKTSTDGKYAIRANVGDTLNITSGSERQAVVANYTNNYSNIALLNNSNSYNSVSSEVMKAVAKDKYPVAEVKSEIVASPAIVTTDANGNTTYSGTVTFKNDNLPLPGITVAVEGKKISTVTDVDGKYQIKANPGDMLVFLYLGMKPQQIAVGERDTIDIALLEDANTLEEVVVVGYGTKRKSDVTGSVTTITAQEIKAPSRKERRKQEKEAKAAAQQVAASPANDAAQQVLLPRYYVTSSNQKQKNQQSESKLYKGRNIKIAPGEKVVNGVTNMSIAEIPTDNSIWNGDINLDKDKALTVTSKTIEGRPNATFLQTIQGQMPGLIVSTGSGAPGSSPTVVLRGMTSLQANNAPLVVIDGIPTLVGTIKDLNEDNIESISILKNEEATALYGNRAVNGVIIVKTKNLSSRQKRQLKRAIKNATKQDLKTGYLDSTSGKFVPMEKIKIDTEEYESFEENKFEKTATTPLSTFSIDVDNASYTNVRRFINNGQTVPKDAVRVEEMINFFKYSYPQPKGNDPFSVNTEYSDAPWNPKHKLLKIGLQGKELATKELPASNFVFLIDVSGSMDDSNKLPLLKQSMKILVNQMRKQDKIAIVVYAGAAGLVLPSTSGDEKTKIIAALDNLSAGGSTAGGAGIELAYKTAQDNFAKGGNNRVILATDGDFNVGASSNADMQTLIEEKRKSGVFLTCLGYGMGNYKDSKLETLADKGNGNYAYIDNMQEADRFLDKEFKGSMYAIAKDVKIQIEFNPKHVQSYRLIGYENRKLRDEDFTNDAIDAGELGSGHTVTALYEIIPTGVESDYFKSAPELKYSQPQSATGSFNDELATIKLRHKKPDGDVSSETVSIIPNTTVSLQQVSADFKFAASVAWFGLKLRDSKLVPNKATKDINELAKQGSLYDPEGYRAEFLRLIQMVE